LKILNNPQGFSYGEQKMKKIFTFSLILLFSLLFSEQTKLDSLKSLAESSSGKEKVQYLNEIGKQYWGDSSDKTLLYSEEALELSKKIKYKKGEAQSLNNIGVSYYFEGDFERTLEFFIKSLELREEVGDKKDITASLNNLGSCYDEMNDLDNALKYYLQALAVNEDLNDPDFKAGMMHNIGVTYEKKSDYHKALEYFLLSEELYRELDNKTSLGIVLGTIGIIFKNFGNFEKALGYQLESLKLSRETENKQAIANALKSLGTIYLNLKNYDKAIEYDKKALKVSEELGDRSGVADYYNSIGVIYDDEYKFDEALENYLLSLKIYEEIGDVAKKGYVYNNIGVVYDKLSDFPQALIYHTKAGEIFNSINYKKGMASSLNNIATVQLNQKNYKEALTNYDKGLEIALEIDLKDLILEIYKFKSELYSMQKKYKLSLKFYKLYAGLKDSIFTKEGIEKMAGIQTAHDVHTLLNDREKEIELLQKDNEIYKLQVEKHDLTRWKFYLGFGAVFIAGFFIFYLYRTKKKANILLEKQVEERTLDLKNTNQKLTKEITERKKIENQLIRSERLAGVGELAAGVAHEIRNPLGNISSSAQFCLSKFAVEEKMEKYLRIILEDSEKANLIIKGLLDFANPRELKPEKGFVEEIFKRIFESVETRCKEKNIKIESGFAKEVPILMDKKWFEQALLNLIINAIQSMSDNGELTVKTFSEVNELKITIQDTGSGISEENMKKVFDPFFTTKENGVGLGLSLAHEIISDHKGRFNIDSLPGKGTTITIYFPMVIKEEK
jgi:signal transduction histidine kinase/Tfp pilus assembly protein PilF